MGSTGTIGSTGRSRGLVTPEGVLLAFEPAGLASRTLSKSLDLAIQFGILLAIFSVAGITASASSTATLTVVVLIIATAVILLVYPALMERFNGGRTVGQMAVGLRVVRVDGGPVGLGASAARAALLLVDLYASAGGIGGLSIALTRRHQRLGDMVAGTMVIREKTGAVEAPPLQAVIPPQFVNFAGSLPLERIDASDLALAREVMRRSIVGEGGLRPLVERAADLLDSKMGRVRPRRMPKVTFLTVVLGAADRASDRVGRSRVMSGSASDTAGSPGRGVETMEEFPVAALDTPGENPDPPSPPSGGGPEQSPF